MKPRTAVLLVGLVALVSGLLGAPAGAVTTGAAAGGPSFDLSPAFVGERVAASGRLPTKVKRAVVLQRKQGTRWVRAAAGRTKANGTYRMSFRAPGTTSAFRVSAPAVKVRGKRYRAVTTRTTSLTIAGEQRVTLRVPATAPAGSTFTATATAAPPRAGQDAQLQELVDATWQDVEGAQERTSQNGVAVFSVAPTGVGSRTYRAVVSGAPSPGTATSASATITLTQPAPVRMTRTGPGHIVGMNASGSRVLRERNDETFIEWDHATRTNAPAQTTPVANSFPLGASKNLRYVMMWAADDSLVRWDRTTGQVRTVVSGEVAPLVRGRLSDDGRYAALESKFDLTENPGAPLLDKQVFVWDAADGAITRVSGTASIPPGRVPQISGNGRYLFYNSTDFELGTGTANDYVVARYDRITGQVEGTVEGLVGGDDAAPSYDGSDMVVVSQKLPAAGENRARVWHDDAPLDVLPASLTEGRPSSAS